MMTQLCNSSPIFLLIPKSTRIFSKSAGLKRALPALTWGNLTIPKAQPDSGLLESSAAQPGSKVTMSRRGIKSSMNIVDRIFSRKMGFLAPGTSISSMRKFHENIVPNHTERNVHHPPITCYKFTEDGRFFIAFMKTTEEASLYLLQWPSIPSEEKAPIDFDSFFIWMGEIDFKLPKGELLCKDFFLYVRRYRFGLFASEAPSEGSSTHQIPSSDITLHLVDLDKGKVLRTDEHNDVSLLRDCGVSIHDDLLAVASLRHRKIHIRQISREGLITNCRTINLNCHGGAGLPFTIQVLFLDREHLLIKWSSIHTQGLKLPVFRRNDDNVSLLLFDMSNDARHVEFNEDSSNLYWLFERFCDQFYVSGATQFNNRHTLQMMKSTLDKLNDDKSKSEAWTKFKKEMLSSLPFHCQSLSPSPYFDQSLFLYDEKLISALERLTRESPNHLSPISFNLRNRPEAVKFDITPGPRAGTYAQKEKGYLCLFHPHLPLAISIEDDEPNGRRPSTVLNFHFRW